MAERTFGAGPVRVGVDVTSVADVDAAVSRFNDRYLRRLFTEHEIDSCGAADPRGGTSASLAARFAAKEAVLKVLEPSGSRPQWRDIEIVRRRSGACRVRLHGRAAALAAARGVGAMSVSLSHEAGLAVAVVAAACETDRATGEQDDQTDTRHPRPTQTRRSSAMSTTDDPTERIREVLAEHARLPVDVSQFAEDDDLFQAGMTSHASVNVMLALEDAFDVEFPEAMLRKSTFSSIGALRRALGELGTLAVPA